MNRSDVSKYAGSTAPASGAVMSAATAETQGSASGRQAAPVPAYFSVLVGDIAPRPIAAPASVPSTRAGVSSATGALLPGFAADLPPLDLDRLIAERRPNYSLARPFYTDPRVFQADLERVFYRRWLCAGHVSQAPQPGDYFTYEIGGESLILSNAGNGVFHALYNVCRHRGSRLCNEPCGHVGKFVCPYHQWVYERDGALARAKNLPEECNPAQLGLKKVHLRQLEGWLWVCFAETPPDFEPLATQVAAILVPHRFAAAKIACTRVYDVPANWKLIVENSRECYHCPIGHPELCRVMGPLPDERGSYPAYAEERMAHYRKFGLNVEPVRGEGFHCTRHPLGGPTIVSETLDGNAVAPRMVRVAPEIDAEFGHDAGAVGFIHQPNYMLEASSDHAVLFTFTPIHATLTRVRADWYVRGDAVAGRDYDLDRVTSMWVVTGEQDWQLCAVNQAGVNSMQYEPGPYIGEEAGVEHFVRWYLKQLAAQ